VDDAARLLCLSLVHCLRAAGVSTSYAHEGNTKKQMALASSLGCAHTLVVGPDEAREGSIVIKNMKSGEQRTIPYTGHAEAIITALAGLRGS